MSNALVQISGTVTNTTIWTPQNGQKGKPVLKIDILQITDLGTHIETIKDDDINASYLQGQQISLDCIVTPWAFDRKNGATLKVYRGKTQDVKLKVQDNLPIGKDHSKSK